jgi:hypothetical protein
MFTAFQRSQPHRKMQLRATEDVDDIQITSGQRCRGITAVCGESELRARLRRAVTLQITHNRQGDRAFVTKRGKDGEMHLLGRGTGANHQGTKRR